MKLEVNSNGENEFIKLTPGQLDSLRELGNIGSGNAVVALSELINKRIEVSLTGINIIPFWNLSKVFPDSDTEIFGICSNIRGEHNLTLLQIYTKESIISMINIILIESEKRIENINSIEELDELTKSTILEIGNILVGHYASSLANLMAIKLIPDVPDLALDTIGAICNSIAANYSKLTDFIIIINTEIKIEKLSIEGIIFFIPSIETIESIFRLLNIK
ncbi:MAG: chemotaxis protein CheC [Promethearchaeota archaeon]